MVVPPPFDDPGPHPNAPRTGALVLAYLGVVVAGALGGMIGWGLVRAGCDDEARLGHRLFEAVAGYAGPARSCTLPLLGGALVGALITALGAAVVAVLMLRAQAEWRAHPPEPGDDGAQPSTSRRKPSA
ncbi:MAG TPA: hypothetical protein VFZ83_02275 [Acidimicrobiia bacterium]|nr:hypothetical protein [Acidimicrobiia bacterium]